MGEGAAVRLVEGLAVAGVVIGEHHRHMADPPVVVQSVGIGDVALAADEVGQRDLDSGEVLLEQETGQAVAGIGDAATQDREALDALIAANAEGEGLQAAAGIARSRHAGRIDRPVENGAGPGALLFQIIHHLDQGQAVGFLPGDEFRVEHVASARCVPLTLDGRHDIAVRSNLLQETV